MIPKFQMTALRNAGYFQFISSTCELFVQVYNLHSPCQDKVLPRSEYPGRLHLPGKKIRDAALVQRGIANKDVPCKPDKQNGRPVSDTRIIIRKYKFNELKIT